MSISGISSNDYLYQFFNRVNTTQSDFLASSKSKSTEATATSTKNSKDQIATDLNALWEALQAGNLTSAQSYFSQLQKDVQAFGTNDSESTTSVLSSSSSSESNPMAEDFSTLEEALNSGDLTGAQNAFAQIMQHMQPPPPPPNFNASNDTQSGSNPLADDLKTLEEALNSGDLTSAQTILAQIMQHIQPPDTSDRTQSTSTTTASNSVSSSNPLVNDLNTLEEELQSGDLTGAKNTFATIMQHMQGPPPPPPDANAFDSSTTTAFSSTSDSNPLADDLKTLDEALNSGDLTSAQTILAQIMQNMQPPDASASGGTQGTSTSSLFSSGNSDMMSKLIEAMLTAYSGYNTSGESKSSYYA